MLNTQEMNTAAESLIVAGFQAGTDHDEIKGSMLAAKIPFGRINGLFKKITIEKDLVVAASIVTANAGELIAKTPWQTYTKWEEVQSAVDSIVEHVKGSSAGRILTLMRVHCRENEIKLPQKTRAKCSRATGGRVPAAIVELFNSSAELPTKVEFHAAVMPLVRGYKNAVGYFDQYGAMCLAIKDGITIKEALDYYKGETYPVEAVAEEGNGAADEVM